MTHSKPKRRKRGGAADTSPAKILREELQSLRRDLRVTLKAYGQRLEKELERSVALVTAARGEELSRERLHDFRDAMTLVRKRKLKPENGRRKDLRKIDSLIEDLRLFVKQDGDA
jgi:hypothetical protein